MKTFLTAAALAVAATSATAATVTFDTLGPSSGGLNEHGFYGDAEHHHDAGVGEVHGPVGNKPHIASLLRDTMFAALTIDIRAIGGFNVDENYDRLDERVAYDNLTFDGYLNGKLVASDTFSTGTSWTSFTYTFGEAFARLDRLDISTPRSPSGPIGLDCDDCSTIIFDNLEFAEVAPAPVPLPATGLLLIGGLAALGLRKRRV